MKNKNYKFPVVIERDEDGIYVSRVPDLPGCNTQARTIPQLLRRTQEAIALYISATKTTRDKEITSMEFVGVHEVEVAK